MFNWPWEGYVALFIGFWVVLRLGYIAKVANNLAALVKVQAAIARGQSVTVREE